MNEIEELFNSWKDLNIKVGEKLGSFEMTEVKKLRIEQSKTEDVVYEILKEKATPEVAKILPEKCGDMEIGINIRDKEFYFVMEDPDPESEKLMAIVFGIDENIKIVNDFDVDEYD